MDKAKLIKKSNTLVSRITVITLTFMMLLSGMHFSVMSPLVAHAADAGNITTWAELEEALEAKAPTITIAEDLYADKTLEIKYQVTIKGKDGQTIYQSPRGDGEKYQTMFNVVDGGDLTLGEKLTLSGKTCTGGGGGSSNTKAKFKMEGGDYDGQYLYVNNSGILSHYSTGSEFEIDTKGYLLYNGNYIGLGSGNTYECSSSIPKEKALQLIENGTTFIDDGNINTTDTYGLFEEPAPSTWKFANYNEGAYAFIQVDSYNSATNGHFKATDIQPAGGGGSQGCDSPDCNTYTNSNFEGGSVGEPKGFFVQVETGGKTTLDGATLEHFYTSTTKDETVKHVAPVVANGGTFNITSGKIQNNVVGYIVDDGMSDSDANAIKQYIKGAAPNAPRTGSLADADNRRRKPAGIDDGVAGSGITGTAGAVIYSGGAKGTISGGFISFNRGDTGGIMVSGDGSAVDITGENVSIDHNVGVQFGGGAFVEDGGFIGMSNGTMSENVAWFGGGAVFATENGISWLMGEQTDYDARKDGKFTLNGGTLDNNTSFTRGGAILADSDGVALIKGTLSNNKSRMLGGAVYVMGDDPRYTYLVYIENGYVHDNKAVSATMNRGTPATALSENKEENMALSKILNSADPCEDNKDLFTDNMTKNSDDMVDGPGNDGTGGGIWLCAYGNTNLNLDNNKFIVDKNYASGSVSNNYNGKPNLVPQGTSSVKSGGNDIHKDTKGGGNVVFSGISQGSGWMNENTGNDFAAEFPPDNGMIRDYGQRNLGYTGNATPSGDYVNVTGNISRRGGGLAADGTFVFGTAQNIANIYAEMEIEKKWKGGSEPEDIVVRVYAEKAGKKYYVQDVPLTEEAQTESELDTVFSEKNYKGRFVVPMTVEDDQGNVIQVFEPKIGDKTYNLNDTNELTDLAEEIDAGNKPTLDTSSVKFVFEEGTYDDDGNFVKSEKYNFISDNVYVDTADAQIEKKTQQLDSAGKTREVLTVSNSAIYIKNPVINDIKSEIEKYVNEAVHKDIAVDEVFKYDILAYVSADADKVTITDTLVEELEFAPDKEVSILDLGETNNHKVNNDVSGAETGNEGSVGTKEGDPITVAGDDDAKATAISGEGVTVDIDGQKTLKVTLDNGVTVNETTGDITRDCDTVTNLRGHWVKVSFYAQIKQEIQAKIKSGEMSIKDLPNINIEHDKVYKADPSIYEEDENRPEPNVGNAPVESEEDHAGIVNTASYKIEVVNEAKYQDESNTVTVKPEYPELEKYVNQAVHKNITLDEVFTYDIIGYITKDAEKVVFEDELVDDLEFVDTENIKVESLTEDNHKPYNNINGEAIEGNDDASVAQEGSDIKDADGVTVETKDGKLTVTIDNEATIKDIRGQYVRITFNAQIKKSIQNEIKAGTKTLADLSNVKIKADENKPVLSDEAHNGIKNDAKMNIFVDNEGKYDLTSNTVTVKPEQPEIEKYVNQAVHKYIDLDEVFTYDIIAYVTKDADEVTITDELDSQLQFVSEVGDIAVADLGREDNHKVTNNIDAKQVNKDATVAEAGETIKDADVSIDGQKLQVRIANAADYRGHWVKVTFDAKIKDGLTTGDLTYTQIDADAAEDRDGPNVGNAPVISDDSHDGVPNKAAYTIGVKNGAEIEEKYKDESNTVTVKPEEFEIEVSKQDLDGNDVAGAKLVVLDSKGIEVESWTSEDVPHSLKLKAGDYILREASAPSGLKLITTPVKFSVDANGKVILETTSVDNGGKVSVTGNYIALLDAPVEPDLQKFVNYDKNSQKLKAKEDTVQFRIVATVPYGVTKFEITDPIPKPLLYVEDSLQIFIDDDLIDETSAVMATESPNYIAVAITSDDDGTIDVSEVYGKDVAITFECKLDPNADLSKYKDAVNTAYVFLNDSDEAVASDDDDKASVLGISELADEKPSDEKENERDTEYEDKEDNADNVDNKQDRGYEPKRVGANTGDNTPIELALFGLIASAAAFVIIRRRREN